MHNGLLLYLPIKNDIEPNYLIMAAHKVTTVWKGDTVFESDNPNETKLLVGSDHIDAFGPKPLMLSSLAGCSGLDVASLLKKMRVEVADFKMEINAELTDEHPRYYHKVHVDYHFYGTDMDEKKVTKAVNLSVDKYCGVMEMFRKFATVTTEIHLHEQ